MLQNNKPYPSCQLQIQAMNNSSLWQTDRENIKVISSKTLNELKNSSNLYIRIHSSCFFSEQVGGLECDCVDQLKSSLWYITNINDGIVFYLDQEGRGHGIREKINITRTMQENQVDTYEACDQLALAHDIRDYSKAVEILKELKISSVNLITNNPSKKEALIKNGIDVSQLVFLPSPVRQENEQYLESKQKKHNHALNLNLSNNPNKTLYFYHPHEENGFLSNLSKFGFMAGGLKWLSVEHFYKSHKYAVARLNAQQNLEGLEDFEQEHQARRDWVYIKQAVMFTGLFYKFNQNFELKNMLLETGDSILIERSLRDYYWGIGEKLSGENNLGKLLMKLREILQNRV